MKRIAAIATVLTAAALWAVLTASGGHADTYRIDALFDNAANLIPGQDVKIAGAKVGSVAAIKLTSDRKARVEMDIDGRFAPFRSDADCTIQPQSLIGEKFIQCTPGSVAGKAIASKGGQPPTVPLSGTHSPVDIDLVMATFRLPYRERLQVLVSELGMGLAARGEDLNDLIRRANPAIQQSRRVLDIVDGDRERLRALVGESDHIVGELARRKGAVADFIDRAQRVTATTASHRGALGQGIDRLPPLLSAARPALDRLHVLADTATPILRQLRGAAPSVNRLIGDVPPLADAARPALKRLGTMADTGIAAVREGRPVVSKLRAFAAAAQPTGALVNELFQSLRERGVVEGLQRFVYFATAATSRFDRYSHMMPAHLIATECALYATTPTPGCDAHFGAAHTPGAEKERSRGHGHRRSHTKSRHGGRDRGAKPSAPAPNATPATPAAPAAPAPAPSVPTPSVPTPSVPNLPNPPNNPTEPVKKVLDWLLGQ